MFKISNTLSQSYIIRFFFVSRLAFQPLSIQPITENQTPKIDQLLLKINTHISGDSVLMGFGLAALDSG